MPTKIFISYAHANESFKDDLVGHLKGIERLVEVDVWDDRRLEGGDLWREEIDAALQNCTIALLLVSKEFIASKFIAEVEIPELLKRHADGELRVVPIIIRPCVWEPHNYSRFQVLPKDGKPVSTYSEENDEREMAWTTIAKKVFDWCRSPQPTVPSASSSTPAACADSPVVEPQQDPAPRPTYSDYLREAISLDRAKQWSTVLENVASDADTVFLLHGETRRTRSR